jgi:hypothetical protein
MKMNSGQFVADGNAVNVDVGFIPDFVIAFEGLEETSPNPHFWFRSAIDAISSDSEFGLLLTGSTGVVTKHAAALNGFVPLDTKALKAILPNPAGGEDLAADLPDAFVAATAQPTARTATALGTITKPSLGNENGLIAECTTSTGVYGTEPTWPKVAGKTVTDDQSNVWTMREEKNENRGIKGFTLGATGQTDTDGWKWVAFSADKESVDRDMANFDQA